MSLKLKLVLLYSIVGAVSLALLLGPISESGLGATLWSASTLAVIILLSGWVCFWLYGWNRRSSEWLKESLERISRGEKTGQWQVDAPPETKTVLQNYQQILEKLEENQRGVKRESLRLEAIQKIVTLADLRFDQERFSREALEVILDAVDLDFVTLYGISPSGQVKPKFKVVKEGYDLPVWEELPIWQEAIRKAAQANQMFLSQDQRYKVPQTEPDLLKKVKPAIAALPLDQKGVVAGVLAGGSLRRAFFDPEELELFLSLSQHLTVSLENFRLYQELREKVIEVTTFNRIGQALSSILEVDQLLKELLQIITTSFGYSVCAVLLYDQERQELVSRALWGYPKEIEERGIRLKTPGAGLCNLALQRGEPVLCNDVNADPHYVRGWPDCSSELAVPFKGGDQIKGVLNVESERLGAFTEKDIHILTTLAGQISILLQNARLYQEEKEKAHQLLIADQINRAISSTLDLNLIFEIVHQGLLEFMPLDGMYFYFYEQKDQSFRRCYYAGNFEAAEADQLARIPVANTHMWQVLQSKEVFVCGRLQPERHNKPIQAELYRMGMRSYVLVPVIDQDDVIGCFNLGSRQPHRFGQREIEICRLVANHLAVAIKNSRIYQELKEAYENLKSSQKTLIQSEKLRTLGEMTSGVVHDFNNLLATILGRTQILLQKLDTVEMPNKETCLKSLKAMEKAAQDGSHLLSQISQFGKVKAEFNLEPVQLHEVVLDSLELTRPRWKNQSEMEGIKIEVKTELNAAAPIRGDAPQLREVLMNLIINAVDAMPKGGELFIQTGESGDKVWLKLQDTGTGMSEEIKNRIFDPFFTTKGKKGTGLGLTICLSIVRRLKGELKVESGIGKGTVFTLIFPKLKDQTEPSGQIKTEAAYSASVFLLS